MKPFNSMGSFPFSFCFCFCAEIQANRRLVINRNAVVFTTFWDISCVYWHSLCHGCVIPVESHVAFGILMKIRGWEAFWKVFGNLGNSFSFSDQLCGQIYCLWIPENHSGRFFLFFFWHVESRSDVRFVNFPKLRAKFPKFPRTF